MIPQRTVRCIIKGMIDPDDLFDGLDEEDADGEELFSFIPKLPGEDQYDGGESEYGDLDDEEFDIDF